MRSPGGSSHQHSPRCSRHRTCPIVDAGVGGSTIRLLPKSWCGRSRGSCSTYCSTTCRTGASGSGPGWPPPPRGGTPGEVEDEAFVARFFPEDPVRFHGAGCRVQLLTVRPTGNGHQAGSPWRPDHGTGDSSDRRVRLAKARTRPTGPRDEVLGRDSGRQVRWPAQNS